MTKGGGKFSKESRPQGGSPFVQTVGGEDCEEDGNKTRIEGRGPRDGGTRMHG